VREATIPNELLQAITHLGSKQVRNLEDNTLLFLVAAASVAFGWILWPFYGAILWATILAISFAPLYRRMLRSVPRWPSLAALATVIIIIAIVILPLAVITNLVVREAVAVYHGLQSGELTFSVDFGWIGDILPAWVTNLSDRLRLESVGALRDRSWAALMESGGFLAGRAINLGQRTVSFVVSLGVMLYLLFFLLRDGRELSIWIAEAIPLRKAQLQAIAIRFTVAIRSILKGTIVVAIVQGMLGGLIFWLLGIHAPALWGALMAVFSLLPVLGAGLVWFPTAIYLLVTGAIWQGLVLLAYGVLVISLVDNILRPLLIGQETKIPDYVVLISTLGGIVVFGANGFVVGPVVAALFIAFWTVFTASYQRPKDEAGD
jgi:predicted PurR-regulated permease PerM